MGAIISYFYSLVFPVFKPPVDDDTPDSDNKTSDEPTTTPKTTPKSTDDKPSKPNEGKNDEPTRDPVTPAKTDKNETAPAPEKTKPIPSTAVNAEEKKPKVDESQSKEDTTPKVTQETTTKPQAEPKPEIIPKHVDEEEILQKVLDTEIPKDEPTTIAAAQIKPDVLLTQPAVLIASLPVTIAEEDILTTAPCVLESDSLATIPSFVFEQDIEEEEPVLASKAPPQVEEPSKVAPAPLKEEKASVEVQKDVQPIVVSEPKKEEPAKPKIVHGPPSTVQHVLYYNALKSQKFPVLKEPKKVEEPKKAPTPEPVEKKEDIKPASEPVKEPEVEAKKPEDTKPVVKPSTVQHVLYYSAIASTKFPNAPVTENKVLTDLADALAEKSATPEKNEVLTDLADALAEKSAAPDTTVTEKAGKPSTVQHITYYNALKSQKFPQAVAKKEVVEEPKVEPVAEVSEVEPVVSTPAPQAAVEEPKQAVEEVKQTPAVAPPSTVQHVLYYSSTASAKFPAENMKTEEPKDTLAPAVVAPVESPVAVVAPVEAPVAIAAVAAESEVLASIPTPEPAVEEQKKPEEKSPVDVPPSTVQHVLYYSSTSSAKFPAETMETPTTPDVVDTIEQPKEDVIVPVSQPATVAPVEELKAAVVSQDVDKLAASPSAEPEEPVQEKQAPPSTVQHVAYYNALKSVKYPTAPEPETKSQEAKKPVTETVASQAPPAVDDLVKPVEEKTVPVITEETKESNKDNQDTRVSTVQHTVYYGVTSAAKFKNVEEQNTKKEPSPKAIETKAPETKVAAPPQEQASNPVVISKPSKAQLLNIWGKGDSIIAPVTAPKLVPLDMW